MDLLDTWDYKLERIYAYWSTVVVMKYYIWDECAVYYIPNEYLRDWSTWTNWTNTFKTAIQKVFYMLVVGVSVI